MLERKKKNYLFRDNMIVYIENLWNLQKKQPEKADFNNITRNKIDMQKPTVFLYASNEEWEF